MTWLRSTPAIFLWAAIGVSACGDSSAGTGLSATGTSTAATTGASAGTTAETSPSTGEPAPTSSASEGGSTSTATATTGAPTTGTSTGGVQESTGEPGTSGGTSTSGDGTTTTTSGSGTTTTTTSGGGDPPAAPANPMGCQVCDCCDPWPISWAAVPGATHYVVRWKCSINPEQVHDVGAVTQIADVCNDIEMCNGMCAFTVGYIKVEACNQDGCSASINIPADQIPITCGGGCCC